MDINFEKNPMSMGELEQRALDAENEFVEVYNPFDEDCDVVFNGRVLKTIPANGKTTISKKYEYYATKPLIDRLIIENEKSTVLNPQSQRPEEVNGFPKIFDDAVREKYKAMILGKTEVVLKKEKVADVETENVATVDTGSVSLNDETRKDREEELLSMTNSDLTELAKELEVAAISNLTRKADLVKAILEKEF
jgi:hypothetical protein